MTYHPEYIESVWWILKELAEKGLLYRGYKSVPYCPRCGTALSSHEVAQGYKDIEDASLFFLCPLLSEDGEEDPDGRAFLAWTTTPWTVPSNVGLAIHPNLRYVEAASGDRRLILAEDLAEKVLGEGVEILRRYSAEELAGQRYLRPLDLVPAPDDPGNSWTVVLEDFVSAEEGTGIVHMAPAFGSDDYTAGQRHGLAMLRPVDDAGCFVEDHPGGRGDVREGCRSASGGGVEETRESLFERDGRSTPIPTAGGVLLPSFTWPGIPGSPPPPPSRRRCSGRIEPSAGCRRR